MELINTQLGAPVAAMLALTGMVWVYLFVQRIGYMNSSGLDVEQLKTPGDAQALIPGDASSASNNFKNLLEMPVLFYVTCFYLSLYNQVDSVHVACAWVFVAFRLLHSLIHCSYNRVLHRFLAYLVASIAAWVMVVRLVLSAL